MKYLLILTFILLLSCTKPHRQNNEITKIELASSGGWNFGTAIGIDSSLNYKYYDGNSKKNFVGKISAKLWDSINTRSAQIEFKKIPAYDHKNIADATYFELIIYWKDSSRRITRVRDIKTDSVADAFAWIKDSYKRVKLHQVNYPIKFETTYQDPIFPPKPKIDQVRFPPPIKQ
jgi:hypothetical protein